MNGMAMGLRLQLILGLHRMDSPKIWMLVGIHGFVIQGTHWTGDAIQLPTIQALHQTLCIHQTHKANSAVPETAGSSLNNLFGQFAPCSTRQVIIANECLRLFMALGFVVNLPKSMVCSTQKMEFLGFVIDTVTMTIALPAHNVEAIQKEAPRLLQSETVQTRILACFTSTLVATKPAVPLALLHFQALQDLKDQALYQYQTSYQSWVQLSYEAKTNLHWWKTQLPSHLSTSLLKPEVSIVITTNVSKQGWEECVKK